MIPITLRGEKFKLVFNHHRYDPPMVFSPSVLISARTDAILYNEHNKEEKRGIAFCNVLDRFEKEKGRRLALQKLLTGLPRDLRKTVFSQYEGRWRGGK